MINDYNFYSLQSNDSIGDTLSNVNTNYLNLELATLNLVASSQNFWQPMLNYFLAFQDSFNKVITISKQNSSVFFNTTTYVENFSAGWLAPITIVYPSLFPSNTPIDSIKTTLSSWIQDFFPVVPEVYIEDTNGNLTLDTLISDLQSNFIEGQQCIVYSHTWCYGSQINSIKTISDYLVCGTSDINAGISCTTVYSGVVYDCEQYKNGFKCNNQKSLCSKAATQACKYTLPYLTNNNTPFGNFTSKNAASTISTTIDMQIDSKSGNTYGFQDRYEGQNIIAIAFKVQNCCWVFDKFITA